MALTRVLVLISGFLALDSVVGAQQVAAPRALEVKYVRDSEEYATRARQVYRLAGDAVERARSSPRSAPWAVVLDVDETTLDNSTYQLERAAYGLPYDERSWASWVLRREAAAVPGVKSFVDRVRLAGGHVAFITNRDAALADATRANLASVGLWNDDDRLCGQKSQYPKAVRRLEVVTGTGDCAWPNTPMHIVAFVGDQMGDFPAASESIPGAGSDDAFGTACFLLPNPMYGDWTSRVTRVK